MRPGRGEPLRHPACAPSSSWGDGTHSESYSCCGEESALEPGAGVGQAQKRKGRVCTLSPVKLEGYVQLNWASRTTTALWEGVGPCGPQSYGFLSPSVQKSSQEEGSCGPLPHPALWLRGLSVPGNILKDRCKSLAMASTLPARGRTTRQIPPLLGVYWTLYQELPLGPRNSGPCGEQAPGS